MEIKASSKYNWETIKKFSRFSSFKKSKVSMACYIIFLVAFVVFAVMFAIACLFDFVDAELIIDAAMILFFGLYLAFFIFAFPKIQFKKNAVYKNSENTFVFRDEEFTVSGENNICNGTSTIKYTGLHKVYETREYIYLYATPRQAYIVDKEKIEKGKESELTKLLINNVGDKYKVVF